MTKESIRELNELIRRLCDGDKNYRTGGHRIDNPFTSREEAKAFIFDVITWWNK